MIAVAFSRLRTLFSESPELSGVAIGADGSDLEGGMNVVVFVAAFVAAFVVVVVDSVVVFVVVVVEVVVIAFVVVEGLYGDAVFIEEKSLEEMPFIGDATFSEDFSSSGFESGFESGLETSFGSGFESSGLEFFVSASWTV